ncbi:MAG: sensor histidine kinase [Thermoleophilia bacterium]
MWGGALAPWREPGRLARALFHVSLTPVLGLPVFAGLAAGVTTTGALLITFLLALPVIWLMLVLARGAARLERTRVTALLDVDLPDPVPPLLAPTWFGRLGERLRSGPRRRELAYLALMLPVGLPAVIIVGAAWCASLAAALFPGYVWALPGDTAVGVTDAGGVDAALVAGYCVAGTAGLAFLAPWLTLGAARLEGAMARALLGRDRGAEAEVRAVRAETGRRAAVDAAEAERRRIERDLHDGAQQRLVALAVGLGDARRRMESDPAAARGMVADAHEEAKAALAELRDLVRGIHPVVLHDRGLDAALSAVVARSPVPVDLDVQVPDRLPPAVESAAYYIVSEALTNIAVHSGARRAAVALARAGERLVVEVRDDGRGGADPARGTGLRGLRNRVEGLGGVTYVISPEGGPTTILAEIPCGS